ncbi:MAG: glycosyltransferase 87 family protein [Bacteroidota bacterium]
MNFIKTNKIALFFALFGAVLYGSFTYDLVRHDFIKLISLVLALFFVTYQLIKMHGWNFWVLAGVGIVFRILFLPAIPNLSQDFYRFLWDGRLVLQGINPYLVTPELYLETGNEVVNQAHELYAGMGTLNGSHYSNYPPINQLFFAIAALFSGKSILGSAVVLRILIVAADIGILYFGKKLLEGLKLPVKNIFWYFLNPFIIIELTGNLHFEGVMLFFVVWALYLLFKGRWFWAAFLLGISISVKLLPLLLLPLFFQFFVKKDAIGKGFWRLTKFYIIILLTIGLTFAPFLSSEFISNFFETISLWFQDFEFNASIYYIIRWIGFQTIGWNIIADVGKILPLVVIFILLLLTFFRKNGSLQPLITALLFAISIYFLLSTTVHPWYIATPVVLSVFTKYRYPIVWSLLVMLSYSAYAEDGFSENLWLVALEYLGVSGYLVWELFFRKKQQAA